VLTASQPSSSNARKRAMTFFGVPVTDVNDGPSLGKKFADCFIDRAAQLAQPSNATSPVCLGGAMFLDILDSSRKLLGQMVTFYTTQNERLRFGIA
jgi:hypothetical protein